MKKIAGLILGINSLFVHIRLPGCRSASLSIRLLAYVSACLSVWFYFYFFVSDSIIYNLPTSHLFFKSLFSIFCRHKHFGSAWFEKLVETFKSVVNQQPKCCALFRKQSEYKSAFTSSYTRVKHKNCFAEIKQTWEPSSYEITFSAK